MSLLEVSQLRKVYSGFVVAVDDLSFSIKAGERTGLLGLNGAGKSTTFKSVTGLLVPDHGQIHIDGISMLKEPRKAQRLLGYLPENAPLCPELTPQIHLDLLCRFYGLSDRKKQIERVVEQCELEKVFNRPIRTLSKGFKQRVALASALIHEPKMLILDEPTSGLDPQQVDQFRQLITKISGDRSVVLSTHVLAEVEAVCNRCLILHEGRMVFDTPLPLEESSLWQVEWQGGAWPKQGPELKQLNESGEWYSASFEMASEEKAVALLSELTAGGLKVRRFSKKAKRLEDVFLDIVSGRSVGAGS